MDRANIVYSSHNRPVATPMIDGYLGMSVNGFKSVSGVVYNIDEPALANDQTRAGFVSSVSSTTNMVLGVLFDYDNNDIRTLVPYHPSESTKDLLLLNCCLGPTEYRFATPDHFA